MKPIPFVIFFMGRSGSTMLASLLSSHPDVFCRNEEFSMENAPGFDAKGDRQRILLPWFGEPQAIDPTREDCLNRLDAIFSKSFVASGFKFKFPNQTAAFPEVLDSLFEMANQLRVIHLFRSNQMKRGISRQHLVSMLQSNQKDELRGGNSTTSEVSEANPEKRKIVVDLELLASFFKRQARQEKWLSEILVKFPNLCSLAYEQMLEKPETALKPILEFLGVDSNVELTTELKKLTPNSLRSIVENYDELAAAYRGTEYEQFLDS